MAQRCAVLWRSTFREKAICTRFNCWTQRVAAKHLHTYVLLCKPADDA